MPKLCNALRDWQTDAFKQTLKTEIQQLPTGQLPLDSGVTEGGMIDDSDISVSVISVDDKDSVIETKLGIFFTEIIGGCNCADDPIQKNAYCELRMRLDKENAEASFSNAAD